MNIVHLAITWLLNHAIEIITLVSLIALLIKIL